MMDFIQVSQAPLVEEAPAPHPSSAQAAQAAPSSSPIPLPPSPHPSTSQVTSTVQANRPILQPAPPSKRAGPQSTFSATDILESEPDLAPAYPPKELVEKIRSRQRQERALHIRLSICSGLICNIDSTLSSYKGELEKEEAETIRSYLHKAITRLVVSEKAPLPSPIPTQSKPPRATKNTGHKEKVTRNPAPVATPMISPFRGPNYTTSKPGPDKQPISIPPTENNWAKVAHNGYKRAKATAVLQTLPSSSPSSRARCQPASSMLVTARLGREIKSPSSRGDR